MDIRSYSRKIEEGREMKCQCGQPLKYNERYDSYFCQKCNEWATFTCEEEECFYCKDRPNRPNESKLGRLKKSGLIGCLNDIGVTSDNYKDIL